MTDDSLLRRRSAMGYRKVEPAPRYVLPANTNTSPCPTLEARDLIHIAVQSAGKGGAALICCGVQIEAFDAGRQPIFEPIDDREIAGQIVPERLFDLLAALEGVEFPDSTLCGD
jgi:hypothetical protein